jgi:hypothetical protein
MDWTEYLDQCLNRDNYNTETFDCFLLNYIKEYPENIYNGWVSVPSLLIEPYKHLFKKKNWIPNDTILELKKSFGTYEFKIKNKGVL